LAVIPSKFPFATARAPWCVAAAVSLLILTAGDGPAVAETGTVVAALEAGVAFSDTLIVNSRSLADPVTPSLGGLVTRIELVDQPGARDAADLLARTAGFQVRRYGAIGASAVPSLRGSAPAQIRFFLDGMPLDDAQNGLAGLARIPLDRIEAIEIHRGVVPTGLGGIGGVGAVNFISRPDEDGLDVLARAGSFGERAGRLSAGLMNESGTRSGSITVNGLRADNDFTYLDHNQTFYNTGDDSLCTRENDWIRQWGVWLGGTLGGDELVSRMTLGYDRRDGGRPGPMGHLSPHASVRYERADGQWHLDHASGLLRVDLEAGRQDEYLFDPEGEVGFGPPGTDRSLGTEVVGRAVWSPEPVSGLLSLQTGLEGRGQWMQEWISGAEEPERNRATWGLFGAAALNLASGRIQMAPAVRWQHVRDDFPPVPAFPWLPEEESVEHSSADVSPSLGVVWAVVDERLFLESHAARTVRQPTWVELFGYRGGIDGNRELLPEDIDSVDLAVSFRSGQGGFSGRVAGFFAETDDKIIFVQNSQRTSRATNAGRTRTRGMEVEIAAVLPWRMELTGNLTYQDAENLGAKNPVYAGKKLPFLPDLETAARLQGSPGPWTCWVEAAYMSSNYRDRANTELNKAPSRTLWNVGASYATSPGWLGPAGVLSLTAEIVNLTNNSVYDVEGFPLPGRSGQVAVRVRI